MQKRPCHDIICNHECLMTSHESLLSRGLYGKRTQTCNLPAALGRGCRKALGAGARCNPYTPHIPTCTCQLTYLSVPLLWHDKSCSIYMHLYVFMLLTHMDTSWHIKLMSVPTAFWSHWTDGCLTCRLLGALSCRALTQLRDGLGNLFRTNKSWNIGPHPKNLSVFHVFFWWSWSLLQSHSPTKVAATELRWHCEGHKAHAPARIGSRILDTKLLRGRRFWKCNEFWWRFLNSKWCMCKKMQENPTWGVNYSYLADWSNPATRYCMPHTVTTRKLTMLTCHVDGPILWMS